MELILMMVLTLIAVCVGTAVGYYWGFDAAMAAGNELAYEEGYVRGSEDATQNFPKTLDGHFFSTDAAIRYMNDTENW